jgi:hypothetical protein
MEDGRTLRRPKGLNGSYILAFTGDAVYRADAMNRRWIYSKTSNQTPPQKSINSSIESTLLTGGG